MGVSLLVREMRACGGPEAFRAKYGDEEIKAALKHWPSIARPEQLPPPGKNWDHWFVLAGRGFGKTRTGAETVTHWTKSKTYGRLALVAPTAADARDVMVEGESGIIACSERARFPVKYEPSKRRLSWPNGARATLFSAEEATRLRGPQHDAYWADELPWWADVQKWTPGSERQSTAWDMLQFGLRLGAHPRGIITATPRAIALVRALLANPRVQVRKGSTYDNAANLADTFIRTMKATYEGTRLGRQEIDAEVLDDNPNALFKQVDIDAARVAAAPVEMRRRVVAVDPAVTSNPDSDLVGIVDAGIAPCWAFPSCKGEVHGFIFGDHSDILSPKDWAERVAGIYRAGGADRVIGEANNGGDLVEANLRANGAAALSYKKVWASRGKEIRAEPVSSLYERHVIHHVGTHAKLEDEMTQWDPKSGMKSPNRLDALVWALTELLLDEAPRGTGYRRPAVPPPPRR